ncbi:GNAT family N-acetyltransferase [Microbacterium sp. ZW T5_56]|uniref:GNAT family N-acetyltransferase n=1 Tax=Microbacterium sp. ZW T5_56 TaxID=3378081 RepID=UPI00385549BC
MSTDSSSPVVIRSSVGESDYPALETIWADAVRATHDFLDPADFERIASNLSGAYFPAVSLVVAELEGQPVGFAGVLDGGLEMLFVSPTAAGHGIGSASLRHVVDERGVTRVDVNEQNSAAFGFYERRGFEVVGRGETDGDGRPYPILHLRLTSSEVE